MPAKVSDGARDLGQRNAQRLRCGDDPNDVFVVVDAREAGLELAEPGPVLGGGEDRAATRAATAHFEGPAGGAAGSTVRLDWTTRRARDLQRPRGCAAHQQPAVGRDEGDEPPERLLHRLFVGEDVGVVELHRREDDRARVVVQELRPLVEERGVVFVALDDERAPVAQAPRAPEVEGDAADQERGIAPGLGQDVRHDRRRGRLAVGAGYDDAVAFSEEQLGEQRGKRRQRELPLPRRHDLDVVLAANVADNDALGGPVEVRRREAVHDRNLLLSELGRHRRIDVLVGTTHVMTRRLEKAGERAHAGSADSDEVNFHSGASGRGVLGVPSTLARTRSNRVRIGLRTSSPRTKSARRSHERTHHPVHPAPPPSTSRGP